MIAGVSLSACSSEPPPLPPAPRHIEQTFSFEALGDVRIIKSPHVSYAILGDGTKVSLPMLRKLHRSAHRRAHGPRLRGFDPEEPAPRRPGSCGPPLPPERRLARPRPPPLPARLPEAKAAQAELVAALAEDAATLTAELESSGFEVHRAGRDMPVLFVRAPAAQLLALNDARWSMVMAVDGLIPVNRQSSSGCNGGDDKFAISQTTSAPCHVDPNVFHHIDTVFNDGLSQHAAGQTVAIYEISQEFTGSGWQTCGIYEDHVAFSYSNISYAVSPDPCDNAHTTAVTSVISGMTGSAVCGSSIADIFVPNHADYTTFYEYGDWGDPVAVQTSACMPTMTVENSEEINDFEAMAAVNESYGCLHQGIHCDYGWARVRDGFTQDYYARYFDHVVVKAAGNENCPALDKDYNMEACPFTLNSICVGAVDSALDMACFSSHTNPGHDDDDSSLPSTDREEPDVVAYGGQGGSVCTFEGACLASTNDPEEWIGGIGTSFAAPVVTSLVALYRAECEPVYEARFGTEYIRALMRTAAWGGNAHGTAYSTPRQPETDWEDGGGVIFAEALAECPDPEDVTIIVIDLEGGDDPPDGDPIYIDPGTGAFHSPNETQNHQPPPKAQPADYADPPGMNRKVESLGVFEVAAGTRIRPTVSWSGCADEPTGEAPGQVAVDFDLFLLKRYEFFDDVYVWASQSVYDNNEGFDYTSEWGGTYELFLSWPEGAESCEGTQYEPVGVAIAILE